MTNGEQYTLSTIVKPHRTAENDENNNVTSKKNYRTEDSELSTGLKQHENTFA